MLIFDFFKPPKKIEHSSFLPALSVSQKLQNLTDKAYLDFITGLYVTSKQTLDKENQIWFLEEIAIHLKLSYPNLTKNEIFNTLQQIVKMSENDIQGDKP